MNYSKLIDWFPFRLLKVTTIKNHKEVLEKCKEDLYVSEHRWLELARGHLYKKTIQGRLLTDDLCERTNLVNEAFLALKKQNDTLEKENKTVKKDSYAIMDICKGLEKKVEISLGQSQNFENKLNIKREAYYKLDSINDSLIKEICQLKKELKKNRETIARQTKIITGLNESIEGMPEQITNLEKELKRVQTGYAKLIDKHRKVLLTRK